LYLPYARGSFIISHPSPLPPCSSTLPHCNDPPPPYVSRTWLFLASLPWSDRLLGPYDNAPGHIEMFEIILEPRQAGRIYATPQRRRRIDYDSLGNRAGTNLMSFASDGRSLGILVTPRLRVWDKERIVLAYWFRSKAFGVLFVLLVVLGGELYL